MRIAVGGIGHESNTFSTLSTGLEDFRVQRGAECLQDDFWTLYRKRGIELAPTLLAGATPHGPVRREAYLSLKEELLQRLAKALPVDGIYLRLHGAMEVEEIGDGESDLIAAVRALAGAEVPMAASLDLHGNLAPACAEQMDVMTALRTAPHRDGEQTMHRALARLIRCLEHNLRPVSALIKLPLLLPGEYAVTEVEPARSLYRLVEEIEAEPGMMDASLFIGCAWTDSPFTSVSALAVAEESRALACRQAARLARAVWAQREAFGPDVESASPEEAVARALASREAPVFISDAGDNVTAGGAGDIPLFIELLLAAQASDAVVAGLVDAEAVARCARAGIGAQVSVSLGAKLDRIHARPLPVAGKVTHLSPGEAPELAALQVEGVTILLTAGRRPFFTFSSLQQAGIEPMQQRLIVIKQGYLSPELRDHAPRAILALSPGFTDLRVSRLPYHRVIRPIFPLDREMEWQPPAGADET